MKIEEAVKALEEGEKIKLPFWPKGIYIYMDEEGLYRREDGSLLKVRLLPHGMEWDLYEDPENNSAGIEVKDVTEEVYEEYKNTFQFMEDEPPSESKQKFPSNKTLRFWQAMKLFEEGKKVRCVHWDPDAYIWIGTTEESLCDESQTSSEALKIFTEQLGFDLIFEDWEIYTPPYPTFLWAEVIEGLKNGKAFRRPCWPGSYRVFLAPSGGIVFEDSTDNEEFYLYPRDYEMDDWIEVKDEA